MPPRRPARLRALGLWLLPLALAFALYGRCLSFPVYWDDVFAHFLTRGSFAAIWLGQIGFQYYRPALFTLYKLWFDDCVPQLTFVGYGLVLTLHGLGGAVMGKLAYWLARQRQLPARQGPAGVAPRWVGLIAALLFVTYPGAAFDVLSVATLHYMVVTFLILLGTYGALRFARQPRRRWWLLALASAGLAPYFNEAGVVTGAAMVWGVMVFDSRAAWKYKWHWAAVVLASAAFLPLWLLFTRRTGGVSWPGGQTWLEYGAFFLQSVTFPLQPVAAWLSARWQWDTTLAVGSVGSLTLLALAAWLWRQRQGRSLVYALGGLVLIATPEVLALPSTYVLGSPRFFYYLAPGIVWLWLTALCTLAAGRRALPVRGGLLAAGLALVVVPAICFVEARLTLYELALAEVRQLMTIAQANPAERQLAVNLFSWLADDRDVYPFGRYGALVMPSYLRPDQLVEANLHFHPALDRAYVPLAPSVPLPFRNAINGDEDAPLDEARLAALLPAYDRVWLTTYADPRRPLEEVGQVRLGAAAPPGGYQASFEDRVFLTAGGYRLEGRQMAVTLTWSYLGPDPGATVFRHVFDCAGNVLGLGDGHALGRLLPFGALAPGARVRDVRHIPLDSLAADGCYTVEVGLFRPDGSRVTARAPAGLEFENAVVPLAPAP